MNFLIEILSKIVVSILTLLASKAIEANKKRIEKENLEKKIDDSLEKYKEAYKEAIDSNEPMNKEKRKKLNEAISNLIRGSN